MAPSRPLGRAGAGMLQCGPQGLETPHRGLGVAANPGSCWPLPHLGDTCPDIRKLRACLLPPWAGRIRLEQQIEWNHLKKITKLFSTVVVLDMTIVTHRGSAASVFLLVRGFVSLARDTFCSLATRQRAEPRGWASVCSGWELRRVARGLGSRERNLS